METVVPTPRVFEATVAPGAPAKPVVASNPFPLGELPTLTLNALLELTKLIFSTPATFSFTATMLWRVGSFVCCNCWLMELTAESMLCPEVLAFVNVMVFDSSVPSLLLAETVMACESLPNCKGANASAVLLETPLASTYVDLAVDAVWPPATVAAVVPNPRSPAPAATVLPAVLS